MYIFPFQNVDNLADLLFEGEQISFDRFSKIRFQFNNPTHNPNTANQSDLLDDYLIADLHEEVSDSKYFDGESFNNLDPLKSSVQTVAG